MMPWHGIENASAGQKCYVRAMLHATHPQSLNMPRDNLSLHGVFFSAAVCIAIQQSFTNQG